MQFDQIIQEVFHIFEMQVVWQIQLLFMGSWMATVK